MLTMTLLIGLATYRLWRLAALDAITEPVRNKLLYGNYDRRGVPWIAEMVECVWCLGWWIAGGLTATAALWLDWGLVDVLLVWPAASAVAGLVSRLDPV